MFYEIILTVRTFVVSIFKLFGVQSLFFRYKQNAEVVAIDVNSLNRIFSNDWRRQLYNKGMTLSGSQRSDNFFKECRFNSLIQVVEHVLKTGVSGDIAECGCFKGHSSFIIASLLEKSGVEKSFFVFDSFEGGLSDRGEKDVHKNLQMSHDQVVSEKNSFSSSVEQVAEVLDDFPFVELFEGWIPDRFGEVEDRIFCAVHIDVDLFQPTKDCVEFFYPKLADGGVMIFDDFGLTQFPGAETAIKQCLSQFEYKFFYEMPLGGAFVIK